MENKEEQIGEHREDLQENNSNRDEFYDNESDDDDDDDDNDESSLYSLPENVIEIQLVSQGANGCIYRPNINCDTGEPEDINYISKIQTNTNNIQNEINISNIIKTIDNYNFHFAPILSNCKTTISKIKDSEIKKCKLLNPDKPDQETPSILKTGELISTKMRYVGSNTLETYLLSIPNNRKDLIHKKIYSLYIYLLYSIRLLSEKDIIHFDLKENNAMYDLKNNSPIIIDFGNSFVASNIKTYEQRREYFYTPEFYLYWTIEVHFLNYIAVNKLYDAIIQENDIQTRIDFFFNGLEKIQNQYKLYISKKELQDFKIKNVDYFKSYIGQQWEKMYTDFLVPEIYKTWDLYAISITFLSLTTEVLKERTPVNTISVTSQKSNSRSFSNGKTEKITESSQIPSQKSSDKTSENKNEGFISSITNFFTPKEEDSSQKEEKKGGNNTLENKNTGKNTKISSSKEDSNKGTISSIFNSIVGIESSSQNESKKTIGEDSKENIEEIPIEYPEEISLRGILPLNKCIDYWKTVFFSLPNERPGIQKTLNYFTFTNE